MNKIFDIRHLFKSSGIKEKIIPGKIILKKRMEVPEKNPDNEWIKLGISAMIKLKKRGFSPKVVADVGTGNGIFAIAMVYLFKPEKIYLTDIVKEVLIPSKKNLEKNISSIKNYNPEIILLHGRDSKPLPKKEIDFLVFSPPPLMVKQNKLLNKGLARTTLIERKNYEKQSNGKKDILLKWSVLPWYVFLKEFKKKMKRGTIILGIYSGRIPFKAIREAYKRAGLKLEKIMSIIKKQQDPVYLKVYSLYEKEFLGRNSFDFYNLNNKNINSLKIPGITNKKDDEIKKLLSKFKITAKEAFKISKRGKPVFHVGHALIGTK